MKDNLRAFFCALVLLLPTSVLAGDPILNLIDVPLPAKLDGGQYVAEEVRRAILTGCRARGWTAVDDGAQKVRASILVRSKHYAEVDIPYSATGYSIIYRTSRELDYNEKKQTIHGNYNKWVVNLSGTIQREFGVRTQVY